MRRIEELRLFETEPAPMAVVLIVESAAILSLRAAVRSLPRRAIKPQP